MMRSLTCRQGVLWMFDQKHGKSPWSYTVFPALKRVSIKIKEPKNEKCKLLTPASAATGLPRRLSSVSNSEIVFVIRDWSPGILDLITTSKCWKKVIACFRESTKSFIHSLFQRRIAICKPWIASFLNILNPFFQLNDCTLGCSWNNHVHADEQQSYQHFCWCQLETGSQHQPKDTLVCIPFLQVSEISKHLEDLLIVQFSLILIRDELFTV